MVSGGTFGTEGIVYGAGYGRAMLILVLLPFVWCLPTTFMVGELASALPAEGGYYAWVRRGLGNFWGFQEAWLSLVASVFDMAIYPTLFVAYLVQMAPWVREGHRSLLIALLVVAICTCLNLAGIRVVGLTSVWLFLVLSAPFALMVALSPLKFEAVAHAPMTSEVNTVGLLGGMLIAMWNYWGWDNASTIARAVDRPQKTYPRAMIAAVILVAASYILPFAAAYIAGVPAEAFRSEGSWAQVAGLIAGTWQGRNWLGALVVLGGMISAFGMFNALVMSYSRLPLAMALDGMLPRIFARRSSRTGAPWIAIVACSIGWALCLGLGFQRLVTLEILLSGSSVVLEFVTLVALRIREPQLKREFRVPGGLTGAVLVGVCPVILMSLALKQGWRENLLGMNALLFGALLVLAGFALYWATAGMRRRVTGPVVAENIETA